MKRLKLLCNSPTTVIIFSVEESSKLLMKRASRFTSNNGFKKKSTAWPWEVSQLFRVGQIVL